jgi:N-acetylglucosamine kinase-like BadF-type ATPase
MSGRDYFLGVDGGGTKTEFLCIDAKGEVVAQHREPTAYHLQVGLEGAAKTIRSGIAAICNALSVEPSALAFSFFGLPAYGEDSAIDPKLDRICADMLGHERFRCGNDMICGWAGSLACEDGINLVAGTGSIGYGERQGRGARVGGWGEIFGDEGSGYWIAIQGLNAFARMSDGRLPKGPMHAAFTEALGLSSDLDICARIMGTRGLSRDGIAALAPVVETAAAAGDQAALAIHERAGEQLAEMAQALCRTLGFTDRETVLVSWSGGVLANVSGVRASLQRHLQLEGRYEVVAPRYSPSYGAAAYAARLGSGNATDARR